MKTAIENLGWTLVHSLWEGALIWLGLQMTLAALRRRAANARYLAGCAALALAALAPWATFFRLEVRSQQAIAVSWVAAGSSGAPALPAANRPAALASPGPAWADRCQAQLVETLPWLVLLWAIGCAWSLLRLSLGWKATRQLSRLPRRALTAEVEDRCRALARRLGIRRAVQIGESILVDVPSVVSWLKPVILVPVGAFAGLSAEQVDGILAHELAHIVRHDFAVNLLQSVCEVLFFYHPALRAINQSIRAERENACDDIAVEMTGDAHGYAAALAKLEQGRYPSLTLAATGGGSLLPRIRRLVADPAAPRRPLFPAVWATVASAVAYLAVLLATPGIAVRLFAEPPAAIEAGEPARNALPMYLATATIEVEQPETIVSPAGAVAPSHRGTADLLTYVQLLKSTSLRNRVAASFSTEEKTVILAPYRKNAPAGQRPPTLSEVIGAIDPVQVGASNIIAITARQPDGAAAALVANQYVRVFMDYLAGRALSDNDSGIGQLEDRARQLKTEMADMQSKLQQFISEKGPSDDGVADAMIDNLKTVSKSLEGVRLQLMQNQNIARQIEDFRANHRDLLSLDYFAENATVAELKRKLGELKAVQMGMAGTYLEQHPKMIEIGHEIAITQKLLDQAIDEASTQLATRIAAERQSIDALSGEYALRSREQVNLGGVRAHLQDLKHDLAAATAGYESILNRLNELRLAESAGMKIPIRPVDHAVPASAPASPNSSHS